MIWTFSNLNIRVIKLLVYKESVDKTRNTISDISDIFLTRNQQKSLENRDNSFHL